MTNARDYALMQLDRLPLPNWPANRLPRRFAQQMAEPTNPRDRALAEQIEVGVVKNLLQLQYWIEHYSGRPLAKVHPLLQKILAIAIYQIRFLDRIRPAAAVDEAVEQTKQFGMTHARGFVNAVLRKAATGREDALPALETAAERAQIHYSHPPELYTRLAGLLGDEQALHICKHNNAEPPTILRAKTAELPIEVTPHTAPGMFVASSPSRADLAKLANAGLAQVQDPTSAKVVPAADMRDGMSVLDRCAGMGTKTLQAWELAGPSAAIVAIDPSEARCEALRRSLIARQITNIRVVQASMYPHGNPDLPQTFDRVLVDAPCSNSGVMARRPEARYRQDDKTLSQLRDLQRRILQDAAKTTKQGARLIYSTCSIWSEENQQVVQHLLTTQPTFKLLQEETTLPHSTDNPADYHDGGYYAILERTR